MPRQPTASLRTPCLLLDRTRLEHNCARMSARMKQHGVDLRPHLKTAKCVEAARIATAGHSGGITVSTLAEAAFFAEAGFRDIVYAVGITPAKLADVARIRGTGVDLHVLLDSVEVARAVAAFAVEHGVAFSVYVEIDPGYHRAGLEPYDPALLDVAAALRPPQITLQGVLAHAGHAYAADNVDRIKQIAREELESLATAARRLRDAGYACPVVSPGSTPTATFAESFVGATECRPGNYMFFDLFQAGLGTCGIGDIAVSVLASVIGHKPRRNQALIDAGALALSKDADAKLHMPGVGYGLVCDARTCEPIPNVVVRSVSQEQGWVTTKDDSPLPFGALPIGGRVRVLPNHSCLTAAAYDRYHVLDVGGEVEAEWRRVNYW